jgi:plastocyanin
MKKYTYLVSVLMLVSAMLFHSSAIAVKHVVTVGNFFFNPSSLNVAVGDTIRWVWSAGSHTTTSTPGAIPSGAAAWDTVITTSHKTYEYKVTVAGSYAYVCTPHSPGMAGTFTATTPAPTLSVSPPNREVTAGAGSTSFNITSNSAWTSSSNATWCTVNAAGSGNGTLTANFTANGINIQRTAVITVMVTGLANQTVTVSQAGSSVGVSESQVQNAAVYPNPSKGIFKVSTGNSKAGSPEITVLDISGKIILSRLCSDADDYSFDISDKPKGYYFIRINSGNSAQVKRIVVID